MPAARDVIIIRFMSIPRLRVPGYKKTPLLVAAFKLIGRVKS
jgi:hypothetical protein